MSKRYHKWTEEEDKMLTWLWGETSSEAIANKLNRSIRGVNCRASNLGLTSYSCYGISLRSFSEKLGYSPKIIKKIANKLGLKLNKMPRRNKKRGCATGYRRYSISGKQTATIIEFLEKCKMPKYIKFSNILIVDGDIIVNKKETWGNFGKPSACLICKTTNDKHHSKGLCRKCYNKTRRNEARRLKREKQRNGDGHGKS